MPGNNFKSFDNVKMSPIDDMALSVLNLCDYIEFLSVKKDNNGLRPIFLW